MMIERVNRFIDQYQPQYLRQEDYARLPQNVYVPTLSDIVLPSLFVAVIFIILRQIFDRYVFTPFAVYFGVKEERNLKTYTNHPLFDKEYLQNKNPSKGTICVLSKKSGFSKKVVSSWFRQKRKSDSPSLMKKVHDASWHFAFYLLLSWYGIFVLWDKSWFGNARNCWTGWPAQPVTNDIYIYYLIELGFYISAVFMLFTDHKRKDFTELIIHHTVTLFLMVTSFAHNLLRIGSLILCVHDQVDYILCLAKLGSYTKHHTFADLCFVLFVIVWILTRLGVYPYMILYSVFIDLPIIADEGGAYFMNYYNSSIMNFVRWSLLILQILHIIWTYLIVKSALSKFISGKVEDARSDVEDNSNESED